MSETAERDPIKEAQQIVTDSLARLEQLIQRLQKLKEVF